MTTTPVLDARSVKALVRMGALAVPELVAHVAHRVRAGHVLDTDEIAKLAYPLIVVEVVHGQGRYQGGLQDVTLEVMAYSDESSDLAMRVYDVFYRGMQARRLIDPQGVITAKGSMREIERPWDGYNERTRSWYARGLWTATLAG